jgi:hypothetical protein
MRARDRVVVSLDGKRNKRLFFLDGDLFEKALLTL